MLLKNPDILLSHRLTVIPYDKRGLGKRLTLLSFHWAPLHQDITALVVQIQYPRQYYDPLPPRNLVKSIKGLKAEVSLNRVEHTLTLTFKNTSLLQFPRELFRVYFQRTPLPSSLHRFKISAYTTNLMGRKESIEVLDPAIKEDTYQLGNLSFNIAREPKEFLKPIRVFQPGEVQRYTALSLTVPKGSADNVPPNQNVVTAPRAECNNPLNCSLLEVILSKIFELFIYPIIGGIWYVIKNIGKAIQFLYDRLEQVTGWFREMVDNFAYALQSMNQSIVLLQGRTRFLLSNINYILGVHIPNVVRAVKMDILAQMISNLNRLSLDLTKTFRDELEGVRVGLVGFINTKFNELADRINRLEVSLKDWVKGYIQELLGGFLDILGDIWDFLVLIARTWRDIGGALYILLARPDLIIRVFSIASVFSDFSDEVKAAMGKVERFLKYGEGINSGLYTINPKTNAVEFGPRILNMGEMETGIDELDFFSQEWVEKFIDQVL